METCLKGKEIEVVISPEKPVIMIGEKINPTGHKKLAAALKDEQYDYIVELANKQIGAGAHILDVNVGAPGVDEVVILPKIISLVAESVDVPICIDSGNPKALEAGLKAAPGKPLVNSVNGEEDRLQNVLPLVKDHGAAVIGLTMDDAGIPETADARLVIAGKIIERAQKVGIPLEDVVIDPLVLTVGADQNAAQVTMETIALVRKEFGVNINLGASNVSFGLPNRQTVNQAFLAMTIVVGANCMITDPMKLAGTILACDLLTGKDLYGKNYITHVRKNQ
jgi:5-methyltetrahydrofolate--homocysteine methyltransferase